MIEIDGIFNINKPTGMTSHDVVARVRRLLRGLSVHAGEAGERTQSPRPGRQVRVGHAGTLDPMATGVLPVVVGRATRLVEYLADADKAYRATLVLGATSDTYDREGTITPVANAVMPSLEEVRHALRKFTGEVEQLPPMYSAVRVGGKQLYEFARAGVEVERKPRRVIINDIRLEAYRPPMLRIYVECSKGTYIRTLAHDLGQALGTGAYLSELTRTRHGPFTIEDAVTLQDLEAAFQQGTWQEMLHPPQYILSLRGWPAVTLTPEQAHDVSLGRPLKLPPPKDPAPTPIAASTPEGVLSAILYWDHERQVWQPKKVFGPQPPPA
jgi:tRNA pseudouridine55 synthase